MKSILIITLLLFVQPAIAGKSEKPLTVEDILADGYKQMTGEQIRAELKQKKLVVLDLNTGAIYESTTLAGSEREQKKTKEEGLQYLTNPELHGQAPILIGNATYAIEGDNVKSTDGVRSFIISLYRKENRILGARDIDHGNVNFELRNH